MNKKILFSDMDGTLLRSDSTVSTDMKKTLDRMTDAGHRLVLTSGRPLDSILEVMEAAGLFYSGTLVIANNGSLIYDCDSKTPLLERTVPMELAAQIIALAEEMGIHVQTYTDHEIICRTEDEEVRYYRQRIHLPLITCENILSVLKKPPYKLHTIDLNDKSRLTALKSAVDNICSNCITALFSNDQYLEFYHVEAGKGNAIRHTAEYFGIPLDNCIAAGDAENDISMLQAAGHAVAMANADPMVKKAAEFITARDNEHDGLIEAIDTLLLGKPDYR